MAEASNPTVLFVCKKNAGRSLAAAALLEYYVGERTRILSGGVEPTNAASPTVSAELSKRGIDISQKVPKGFTEETVLSSDYVVTFGCSDKVPTHEGRKYADWNVGDPHAGIEDVQKIIDDIDAKVRELVAEVFPDHIIPTAPERK